MARPKSPVIAVRDDGIYAAWKHGASLAELAEAHGITPQRVGQVIAKYNPELDDETMRSMHRGLLENLRRDVQDIIDSPGWKLAPNGRTATGPDGEPVADLSAKIEAARTQLAVLESARKLDGVDKPSRRIVQMELHEAERVAAEDIARRRAEIDRQLRVIQGHAEPAEPRELPPAAAEG